MAGYILKQILFSENFKLSNKKRAEIVKNLFTLEELTKLPKPYGEAYYDALQRIEPSIQYVKRC
jgi:hypothetical protein